MKRAACRIVGLILLLGAAAPLAAATKAETDKQIRADLMARKFRAKVNLYEATVDEAGKVETDADDGDAIKVGMPVLIKRVSFARDTIRIYMKNPDKGDTVWVEFTFSQELSPDFGREKEIFEKKMLPAVFAWQGEEPAPGEGN